MVKKIKFQGKEIPLIKPQSEKITRKWLTSQGRTKFGLMLPTASQFKWLSREDKTRWNAVRKQWQKGDMLSKARALSNASGYISSQSDKSGKPLLTANQRFIASRVRNLIVQTAKDSTASEDKKISTYLADHGIRRYDEDGNLTAKAKALITSNQVGSAYIKRDKKGNISNMEDYYKIKRLTAFNKLTKKSLMSIDKIRYKEIFEHFIVYENPTDFTILDMSAGSNYYYGSAKSIQQAMDIIASRLNEDSKDFKESHTGRMFDFTGYRKSVS